MRGVELIFETTEGSGGDKRPENQTPKEFDIFDPRAKYQAS
jgi:hypothetical protein